ncbi:KdsC family phosphatase [Cellulophaga fucicola]|uniref:3-deoxy-D-manno-octulosonate 8-phosphate phosphatase (KDO 8-P phosphatase) n=1 Tax=Cellulophaga fucicola TaxID=76595 RepID=A0A1K1MQQ9_9FLAO|nr:HAD-IIIA family hydrolase [Cellulophaga fucicola]SFW25455.1 3-deoxy-D-manno-octulosonate 8-phosphate phosphatase (KDO 8-P phosphatase) [Cellulophaga fucicola]
MEKSYKEYLHNVTTFVFDVDGVFTDGSVLITEQGELLRKMNVKDGYALKTAIQKGFNVCIISGGTSEGVRTRFKSLGVTDIYLGAHLKLEPINEYLTAKNIDAKNVLYMGDDMPDVPPMQLVGMPTCPQDAIPEIKTVSKYISQKNGGNGCVRDVIEQVLKAQGKWNDNYSAKND